MNDPSPKDARSHASRQEHAAALNDLCPKCTLRFGVVFAPEKSSVFVELDATGAPRGAPADMAEDFARSMGVPLEFVGVRDGLDACREVGRR